MSEFSIIGHRGYPEIAPENTLTSFEAAISAGVDMVELDVSFSRDRELVVMHDDRVNRTTNGRGKVSSHDWKRLRELDAGSWFSKDFSGEQIPSLSQVLECCKGKVRVNVEIKPEAVSDDLEGGIEQRVLEEIQRFGMRKDCIVSSFSPLAVKHIREIDSQIETALILDKSLNTNPKEYAEHLGIQGMHLHQRKISREHVQACIAQGLAVRVYTVNKVPLMKKLRDFGAHGVFTDRAQLMLDAR
ncbi:MAG: hypothetical protein KDD52_01700 [Bdellovibrionales bacterium]|nr:hypothetical protein [Bdellovibrionales bacterium]